MTGIEAIALAVWTVVVYMFGFIEGKASGVIQKSCDNTSCKKN